MTTVRTCPVQCLWMMTVLSLWMYDHFSPSASLNSYPHPMLHGHLSSLGSYISTKPRGFSVAGSGAVPGAVWGVVGTMVVDICPCCQSPVESIWCTLLWCGSALEQPLLFGGDVMPYEKGRAGLSRKKMFFQAMSLSLETLSAVSEVLSPRFVNDTVSTLPHHIGIWAHRASDSSVIHPTYVLALALHQFLKGGGEMGRDWVRLSSSWTLSLWAVGMQPAEILLSLGTDGGSTRNKTKAHLKL